VSSIFFLFYIKMSMSYEEDSMEGKFLPENVRYLVDSMSQYSRNRFRLETVSSESASAGRIITVNLPEGACLDLSSFRLHYDVECSTTTSGTATCFAKLPNDASQSLISRVEVNLNGVAIQQGAQEYNTIYQMKKLSEGSLGRNASVGRAVAHSEINSEDNAEPKETLVVQDWAGFLGAHERSTRFISSDIWGAISVRITLAPNSVLVPKIQGTDLGLPLGSADAVNASRNMTYSVDNIWFSIDSVSLNPIYNEMLRQRLASDNYLPLNYKEYYSFSLDSITSGASTPRFSLSSGSIDKLMGTYRDANYQTTGVQPLKLDDAGVGAGAYVANALRLRSFNKFASADLKQTDGDLRYNWSVNNVQMPQYRATLTDALCDVNYVPDKVGMGAEGTLVCSKDSFNDGKFICNQILNHPTRHGVGVQSGFNSRGINTMMTWNVSGQAVPTKDPNPDNGTGTQASGNLSAFVVLETTAQVRAGIGKNIAVLF
jgi:hypothetical protein